MKIGQPLRMPDPVDGSALAPNKLPPQGETPNIPSAAPSVTPASTPQAVVSVEQNESPVKFDDFENIKSGGILKAPATKPAETPPVVPVVKDEPVVPTKQLDLEPVQDPTKLIPQKTVAQPDVLDGLTDFEKDLLTKKASKEVREYVASTVKKSRERITSLEKENVELKNTGNNKLPQNYNEHPDAYIFNPEYKQAAGTISNLNTELGFYEKQLIQIEKGEDWNELNYNQETGEYSLGPVQKPTTEAKRDLENRLLNGRIMARDLHKTISGIKSQHVQQHQAYSKRFKEIENSYFPDFVDEAKIDKDDGARIKASTEMLKNLGQGNNPLTPILAKTYTMLMKYANYIRSNEERFASIGKAPAKHETGPSSEVITQGGARPANGNVVPAKDDADTPVSFAAFDAVRNR